MQRTSYRGGAPGQELRALGLVLREQHAQRILHRGAGASRVLQGEGHHDLAVDRRNGRLVHVKLDVAAERVLVPEVVGLEGGPLRSRPLLRGNTKDASAATSRYRCQEIVYRM